MKFCANIHCPQRMNPTVPLLHIVPPGDWHFWRNMSVTMGCIAIKFNENEFPSSSVVNEDDEHGKHYTHLTLAC